MFAASPAKGQYESFFGQESWEYATAFHPITKSTADYDPHLLYCLTNIYHFSSSDTVTIDGKVYYNSSVDGYWYRPVKLREDTLYGRLYSLIDGREFLMCDMSLNVGDTFRLPVSRDYDYDETMRMLVDSVTFVNSKKVIHLSAVSESDAYWWFSFLSLEEAYNISLRFMEGVGPIVWTFPSILRWGCLVMPHKRRLVVLHDPSGYRVLAARDKYPGISRTSNDNISQSHKRSNLCTIRNRCGCSGEHCRSGYDRQGVPNVYRFGQKHILERVISITRDVFPDLYGRDKDDYEEIYEGITVCEVRRDVARNVSTGRNCRPGREIPSRGRVCVAREGCGRAGIPTEGCEAVNASYDYFVNCSVVSSDSV